MCSQSERKGIQLRKVLVVEDEEIIRKGIVQLVHTLPGEYAVTEKEHGKAALEHLHANVPDLIISDIRMREMDGLTFLRRAKALYPSVPLMIISGYGDFEYAQQAIRIGVGEFMLKPVNRKAFLLALERLLDRAHLCHRSRAKRPDKPLCLRRVHRSMATSMSSLQLNPISQTIWTVILRCRVWRS